MGGLELAKFSYSSKSKSEHFNWKTATFWQHPKSYGLNMAISTLFFLSKYDNFVPFLKFHFILSPSD